MKYFVFAFFFVLSFTAFSANKTVEVPFIVLDNIETIKTETSKDSKDSKENTVAFECYYTVEWLYIDSPFIKKLDALA